MKEPPRILHIIHRMRPGGIQTLMMNIFRQIDRTRVQFDFAVRSTRPEYYDDEVIALHGRILHLPWSGARPWSIPAYTRALETTIHQFGPFVAMHSHAGLFSGHTLAIAKKTGIPLRLAHSHSISTDTKPSLIRYLWGQFNRRAILNNATHLLACSQTAGEWLYGTNWHTDPRTQIFRNGINLSAYENLPDDKHLLRQKLHFPADALLMGHVGRFDQVKNHKFLIELFLVTLNKFPASHLVLVGEGPLRPQIENMVQKQGISDKVHFLGIRSDIPQILGALDLFILPSQYEGLGIVLIEAQAAGIPCLASDTVPDEVDLKIGLVQFTSLQNSAEKWLERLTELLDKPIPVWAKRKQALQKKGYDLQDVVKQLMTIYTTSGSSVPDDTAKQRENI